MVKFAWIKSDCIIVVNTITIQIASSLCAGISYSKPLALFQKPFPVTSIDTSELDFRVQCIHIVLRVCTVYYLRNIVLIVF